MIVNVVHSVKMKDFEDVGISKAFFWPPESRLRNDIYMKMETADIPNPDDEPLNKNAVNLSTGKTLHFFSDDRVWPIPEDQIHFSVTLRKDMYHE